MDLNELNEGTKYKAPNNYMGPIKKAMNEFAATVKSATVVAASEYGNVRVSPRVYCAVLLDYGIAAKITVGKLADDVNFISHLQLEVLDRTFDVRPVDSNTIYIGHPSNVIGKIPDNILKELYNAPIWQLV